MSTFGAATSVRLLHAAQKFVEGAISSGKVYSSSVVYERGIKVFDDIVRSVTKKYLGVLWGILNSIFRVEFGDLFVNFPLDVRVWNWAFENRVTSCA